MAPNIQTLNELYELSPSSFQSLLHYASSRCRSACMTLLLLRKRLDPPQLELFKATLENELNWSTYLFAIAAFIFPKKLLEQPPALRGLMQLFVRGHLYDFEAMSKVVLCPDSHPDQILSHYELSWWTEFPEQVPESGVVAQQDIFDAWKRQAHALPPAFPLATFDSLAIDMMLTKERDVLVKTVKRALTDVEEEIAFVTTKRARLSEALARVDAMKRELRLNKGKGRADSLARVVASEIPLPPASRPSSMGY